MYRGQLCTIACVACLTCNDSTSSKDLHALCALGNRAFFYLTVRLRQQLKDLLPLMSVLIRHCLKENIININSRRLAKIVFLQAIRLANVTWFRPKRYCVEPKCVVCLCLCLQLLLCCCVAYVMGIRNVKMSPLLSYFQVGS